MKVLVVTSAPLIQIEGKIVAYAPYVEEMQIWDKYADLSFACVTWKEPRGLLVSEIPFNIGKVYPLLDFNIKSKKYFFKAVYNSFFNAFVLMKAMRQTDHIHLRCPGNIGLIGCFVQILFPGKPKTAKYAGNWDPKAKQPWSYRLQKWLLSNTFLTKSMKVLVYGEWPNQSKNIVPFFTATYSEKEINEHQGHAEPVEANFLFVGALTKGKQPLLSVAVIQKLKEKGHQVQLNIYGEGPERAAIEKYVTENDLNHAVILHGNCDKEAIKKAYQQANFLLFISQSEGWPKAVAEAMFWACLPITSKVSCIPYMLANGERGSLVNPNADEIVAAIENYLQHPETYTQQSTKAMQWSRQFTMERFEEGIKKIMSQ
jgi:glycosyltransferase involved in cell wall biosynthesis